ncbi:MAG: glycosyltransferase family 39 protein [Lachnospiraceae bacterium]|nr:glycosyltransferase family 39 protein [Lachnospiraceae bacterium]
MKRENSIFLAAPIAALIVNFLFLQDADYRIPFLSLILLLAFAFATGVYTEVKKCSKDTKVMLVKSGGLVLATLGMIQLMCIYRQDFFGNDRVLFKWVWILGLILSYIIFIFAYTNGEITESTVFLILMAGICIRVFYVVLMQVNLYQNDAGLFQVNSGGHLGYIYHFYSKGTLPDFNPRSYDQFYHPPLHHMIAAVWLKLNTVFGKGGEGLDEFLQSLTLFYSACTLGFLNKIGIKLNISCKGRAIAMGIISFLPFGIMMGGAVNNDGLMLLFEVIAVYCTLQWFDEPSVKHILLMALTIGCAMMTKLSGGLIAPAVAVVMFIKVWKDKRHIKNYMMQFLCFALVAFPLGLWYPIKNLIQYDIPITYIRSLSDDVAQYIGSYGAGQRFFGTGGQFYPLYVGFDNTQADVAYNIPISIVKFLTFGDGNYYLQNSAATRLGPWVFYLTMILLVLAFVAMIIWLFRREAEGHARLLILISVLVLIASYIKFCFDYPHVGTMHVRHIMLAIYFCFLGLGGFLSEGEAQSGKALVVKGFLGAALLYMVLSALLMFAMQAQFYR